MDAMVGMGRPRPFPSTTYPTARARRSCASALIAPPRATRRRYAELHCASAFSFLAGASLPEDLIERAAELELPAVALIDRNGVYGAPRFYKAARAAGHQGAGRRGGGDRRARAQRPSKIEPGQPGHDADPLKLARENEARVTLLVADRSGYQNLCRMLTAGALAQPKGEARVDWDTLAAHAGGLWCLTGGEEGPLARTLRAHGSNGRAEARRLLERLRAIFPGRLSIEVQRHALRRRGGAQPGAVRAGARLQPAAARHQRRALRARRTRSGSTTCSPASATRHPLDGAGALLDGERQRHLKGAGEMARAVRAITPRRSKRRSSSRARLDFTLADLGYRFPDYPLPPGETPASYLRQLTWNGARARFRPLTAKAQAQIEKELALIEKLELAGYFLIVWDVVRFCQEHGILVQGRGSAANSAVCYALSITAVDPVKMELLFERFLSEERGEWPDIDLDLPSGDQREKVIQYVYRRYGVRGAAMTANVITYRDRIGGARGGEGARLRRGEVDRLSKQLGSWGYDLRARRRQGHGRRAAGRRLRPRRPAHPALRRDVVEHPEPSPPPRPALGRHGGRGRRGSTRWCRSSRRRCGNRVVVQWDKDDCADLGIIKVDLLGLGMLNALEEATPMIRAQRRACEVDYAHLPPDDPAIYRMLRTADTVGVFQVESRAQMASLPRHRPTRFYDLVIQIAIIRPGPIVGRHGEPVLRAAHGPPAGDLPAPEPRSRSSSARSACRSSRSRS